MATPDEVERRVRDGQDQQAQANRAKPPLPPITRIGDRDGVTGRWDGNGIKIFNTSLPTGAIVRGIPLAGGLVALDHRNTRPTPTPTPTTAPGFIFVYQDGDGLFVGGTGGRKAITSPGVNPEIFGIHQSQPGNYVGGVRVSSANAVPDFFNYPVRRLIVVRSRRQPEIVERTESYNARPIGYGLWLVTIDFPLNNTNGDVFGIFDPIPEFYIRAANSASATIIDGFNRAESGSSSGVCASILIDTNTSPPQVYRADGSFSSSSSGSIGGIFGESLAYSIAVSGESWILPGVKRPYEFTANFGTNPLGSGSIWQTLMVDRDRRQAICLHWDGDRGIDSKIYLIRDGQTLLNNAPGVRLTIPAEQRQIPAVGQFSFQGDFSWSALALQSAQLPLLIAQLPGMAIAWSVQLGNRTRRGHGRIASIQLEPISGGGGGFLIVSLTLEIDRVVDVPYDFWAHPNGRIVSQTGSVLDLLAQVFNRYSDDPNPILDVPFEDSGVVFGNGLVLGPLSYNGYPPSSLSYGVSPERLGALSLGTGWIKDKLYVTNIPPLNPQAKATNYAEVWKIEGANLIRQDQPVRAVRDTLGAGLTPGAIAGNYHP